MRWTRLWEFWLWTRWSGGSGQQVSDTRAFEWACVSPPSPLPPLLFSQGQMLVVTNHSLTLDALAQAPPASPLDPLPESQVLPKNLEGPRTPPSAHARPRLG